MSKFSKGRLDMDKTDEFIISSEIDASKIDTGELDNISKLFFYSC